MNSTMGDSRDELNVLDRVNKLVRGLSSWKILLALAANKGSSTSYEIVDATCTSFNQQSAMYLIDMGMATRMKSGSSHIDPFKYTITPYGIQILDRIKYGDSIK